MDDTQTADADSPVLQSQPLRRRSRLLEGLDAEAIEAISGHLILRPYAAGDVLIRRGSRHLASTRWKPGAKRIPADPALDDGATMH